MKAFCLVFPFSLQLGMSQCNSLSVKLWPKIQSGDSITRNRVVVTLVPLQEKRQSPRRQSQWKVPKDQTENIKCLDQKRNDEGSASLVRSVKARIERSIGTSHVRRSTASGAKPGVLLQWRPIRHPFKSIPYGGQPPTMVQLEKEPGGLACGTKMRSTLCYKSMRYGVSKGLRNVGHQEAWRSMYFVPGWALK